MLPTPDTSHVSYSRVYEPAEDSFLFLDTLSSANETAFLKQRFYHHYHHHSSSSSSSKEEQEEETEGKKEGGRSIFRAPLVVEVGTGSGVVIGFVHAHAAALFGTSAVLTAGVDVNSFACRATVDTVRKAAAAATHQQQEPSSSSSLLASDDSNARDAGDEQGGGRGEGGERKSSSALFLGAVRGDLLSPLGKGQVDVLIFNPPYVPTEELPMTPHLAAEQEQEEETKTTTTSASARFERDSYLLSLSYAGGKDGMEITDRLIAALPEGLSPRGCAYILLCAGNKPDEVKERIRAFGPEWRVLTVGDSGKQAGWEKLQIIRIWREDRCDA